MARPIALFTNAWTDGPLEELAAKAGEWGCAGLEIACWGGHLDVQRAVGEADYCPALLETLARHDLTPVAVAQHRVGQAVCDLPDERHREILPDYVWGDGDPAGVRERAAEEMLATVQAAERLGVGVVTGFTGSPIWGAVTGWPPPRPRQVRDALEGFVRAWTPVLDACAEAGVRFACEVHPGQLAFDLYSAELVLEAIDRRPEFAFTFDPAHLHWQGVDPVEFIHRFPGQIAHVHLRDAALNLDGRAGLLSGMWPAGDRRRGWQSRCPGRGGVDWEGVIRALNAVGYAGPLAVDWGDPDMDRDPGAEEACRFARRLDFDPRPRQ